MFGLKPVKKIQKKEMDNIRAKAHQSAEWIFFRMYKASERADNGGDFKDIYEERLKKALAFYVRLNNA